MVAAIQLCKVSKSYGETEIVEELNLNIQQGEFITVIGSSGCGKTTVLKMMNGLVDPNGGAVRIYGEDIAQVDQNQLRRNIGYVIQGIGLFPHMSVENNIAYVLNLQKEEKAKVTKRVKEMLAVVALEEEMLSRYPGELSGGQCQRVGIARALAGKPKILLMDEPFGAVDEITRKGLQEEILRIHQEWGLTIVFITHDIQEALKLGTKVLVMKDGKIEQFATPKEIVEQPATTFVAELVGIGE